MPKLGELDGAAALDAKMDDGVALSGDIQAAMGANVIDQGPLSTDWVTAPNLCVNGPDSSAATPYASPTTNNLARCNLIFKLGF